MERAPTESTITKCRLMLDDRTVPVTAKELAKLAGLLVNARVSNKVALFDLIAARYSRLPFSASSTAAAELLWAFVKVGVDPTVLHSNFTERVVALVPALPDPQACKVLWSLVMCGAADDKTLAALATHFIGRIHKLSGRELSSVAWAYGKQTYRLPVLFSALSRRAKEIAPTFAPQSISNTLWAFAKVGHGDEELFRTMEPHIARQLTRFTSQNISNTVWAFATLHVTSPPLFAQVAQHLISAPPTNPQALANITWAFAVVRHRDAALFQVLGSAFVKATIAPDGCPAPRGVPQNISNMLWAFARLDLDHAELSQALPVLITPLVSRFNVQDVSNTLWALARSQHRHTQLLLLLADAMLQRLPNTTPQNLSNVAWAYATLAFPVPELFWRIAQRSAGMIGEFRTQNIANTVWAFAKLTMFPRREMEIIATEATHRLHSFTPQEAVMVAWGLAIFGQAEAAFFAKFIAYLKANFSDHSPRSLCTAVWACAVTGNYDDVLFRKVLGLECWQGDDVAVHPGDDGTADFLVVPDMQRQVYQAYLGWTLEQHGSQDVEEFARSTFPGYPACRAAFLSLRTQSSGLQDQVSAVVEAVVGAGQSQQELILECGLFLDIGLQGKVAVEVLGPCHFVYGHDGTRSMDGPSRFKFRLLQKMGWQVVQIGYWEWDELATTEARIRFVRQKFVKLRREEEVTMLGGV